MSIEKYPPAQIWSEPKASDIADSVVDFLNQLNGPTWFDFKGKDTTKTRVLTTLLHGNEPSGVKALYQWIKSDIQPETNFSCFVGSVKAALEEPIFSHRMLPGRADLNRCFRPPYEGYEGKLAESILQRISYLKPEAVIDVHNTSGQGPNFVISTQLNQKVENLASFYSERLVVTELTLGSLMEAELGCPIVTIECGGSMDKVADEVAWQGLLSYSTKEKLFGALEKPLDILENPVRLEVKPGISVTYANTPSQDANITLKADIEKHNFGITHQKDMLGWLGNSGLQQLSAKDAEGKDVLHKLFREYQGKLYPAQNVSLFMVTTRADIAVGDCLFYVVEA